MEKVIFKPRVLINSAPDSRSKKRRAKATINLVDTKVDNRKLPDVDNEEERISEAYSRDNFDEFELKPKVQSVFGNSAKTFFINIIQQLPSVIDKTDLRDPGEFHTLLWLLVRLGAGEAFIAKEHFTSQQVVSRWVTAKASPVDTSAPAERRRAIIASAFVSLIKATETQGEDCLVPYREFSDRRMRGAIGYKGRCVE